MSDYPYPVPSPSGDDDGRPEVRLELSRAGVQQVLSLYSEHQARPEPPRAYLLRVDDVAVALRRYLWLLLLGTAAGAALGYVLLDVVTPVYRVSAQVVLGRYEADSASTSNALGAGGSAFVATQAEVMQSRSVLADAVASLPRPDHLDVDTSAVDAAVAAVTASPISGTQVVALGYLGADADYGVALLEAVVDGYRALIRADERDNQARKLRAKEAEIAVLEEEAARLAAAVAATGPARGAADSASAQARLVEDITRRLSAARGERFVLESRLATGDQLAILDPAVRTLQEELWAAEAELARVQLTLTPRHPTVTSTRRRVEALRGQLQASSAATPDALSRDLETARALERELEAELARARERLAADAADSADERLLEAELGRTRDMVTERRRELLDQRVVTRLAESGDVGVTARLIAPPAVPESPVWPQPALLLGGGGTLGLTVAAVPALWLARRRRARISPTVS